MKSLRVISALERQLGKAKANIDSELTRRKLKKVAKEDLDLESCRAIQSLSERGLMTLTRLQTSAEELIKKAVEISIGENMLNPKIVPIL